MNAARGGDAYALFSIGYMYLRGVHVEQDLDIARHYFNKAADKGLAEGHNGLGVLYFNGQGVPQNITIAMSHFQAAAKLQNADSMYNLGTIYLEGEDCISRGLPDGYRCRSREEWGTRKQGLCHAVLEHRIVGCGDQSKLHGTASYWKQLFLW